ncbi:MAG: hypothetical protein ACI9B7_001500 [Oleispira sp.]|jgi:hypothetical protein
MSLVNDVLRQLDAASPKPNQAMPLHSLPLDQSAKKNKRIGIFFIVLVVLLLFILTLQLFYKQSLLDVFYFSEQEVLELSKKPLMSKQTAPLINGSKNSIKEEVNDDLVDIASTSQSALALEDNILNKRISEMAAEIEVLKSNAVEIKVLAVKAAKDSQAVEDERIFAREVASKKAMVKKEVYQAAKIKAVEKAGFKQYQLALKAYKKKQNSTALSWIDLALEAEKKDEYLRLKVRILMQQGNGNELHQFILAQHDNTSLAWFRLIAPSLQMYAYYDLSNKYYSELIIQQPYEVKWKLAMALNFLKLGQGDKTYSIYKSLLNSSLLTYQQQKWIATRLARMEQGRIAINER